jgi:hypothetical protein
MSSSSRLTLRRSSVRIGEAGLQPPRATALEGERRAPIDDAIEIVASFRAVARVEIGAHALGAEHRHRMGLNKRVEPLAEAKRGPLALKVDMRDLAPRMHAGVRAPGTLSGHARAGHREQSALQNLLNR